jgi:two-component system chemotaxis response regulator CheY
MPDPKKILVVDDDLNLRETMVIILHNAGYDVACAENAQQGLLQMQTGKYNLVLLDHKMPDMTGLTLVTVIHGAYPGLPILFLTANGSPELEKEARERGVEGYLVKPADPEKILGLVESICPVNPDRQG